MKTQLFLSIVLIILSTAGICGDYMINVPFLSDFLCLWIHYIICFFLGLFGLIWAYFMANQNEIIKNDLKTKNDILMKKLFSAQGNMAQLRTKLKYYKSLNK